MKNFRGNVLFNTNLRIVFTVTLIAVMGVSSITPAFPKIAEELGLTSREVNLLIVFFTVPGIFLSPLMGIMADRFGRKKVLVPSILIFSLCGTLCAFMTDFNTLLFLRFLQGTGAASLSALNQTVIGDLFPGTGRMDAMGYNSSVLSLGTLIYPSLGGALALLGWNYPFLLAIAGFPVAYLVAFKLKSPEPEKNGKIGQYLISSFRLILNKELIALYFGILAGFILLYGVMLAFFPYYMYDKFGANPLSIGLLTSSASIGSMLGAFNLGRLSRYFSSKKLLTGAFLLYTVSLIIAFSTPYMIMLILPVFIYGFANGILIPNIQTRISLIAPPEYRGAVMSINSTVLRLGQTTGPFISGIILFSMGSSGIFKSAVAFSLLTFIILAIAVPEREIE